MSNPSGGGFFSEVDESGGAERAAEYLSYAAERMADMRRRTYASLDLRTGSSVLDVGCGMGEVCADLVELVGTDGTVTGIDLSDELIVRASERWGELPIRFLRGDAEALDFPDSAFDAVRMERVAQHRAQPDMAIAEAARVARPGGRIFVADSVHDASVVATQYPRVWEAIRLHGAGAVRQPRAGLHLGEWMRAAGLEAQAKVVSMVLDSWPTGRAMFFVDEGAAAAVEAGAVSQTAVDEFIAEQQARFDGGVYAQSFFFVQALGVKSGR